MPPMHLGPGQIKRRATAEETLLMFAAGQVEFHGSTWSKQPAELGNADEADVI